MNCLCFVSLHMNNMGRPNKFRILLFVEVWSKCNSLQYHARLSVVFNKLFKFRLYSTNYILKYYIWRHCHFDKSYHFCSNHFPFIVIANCKTLYLCTGYYISIPFYDTKWNDFTMRRFLRLPIKNFQSRVCTYEMGNYHTLT